MPSVYGARLDMSCCDRVCGDMSRSNRSVDDKLTTIGAADADVVIRSDEQVGAVDIGTGSCDVTVTMETYFGSKVLLDKLFNSTLTNVNARIAKDNQALVYGVPRLTFTEGSVSAAGKNQDSMLPLTAMASKDPLTEAHILLDRLEYFEA